MSISSHALELDSAPSQNRALNAALWTVQILLFAVFAMAGTMKSFVPIAELSLKLPWAAQMPAALVRFIGVSELAGALGLLLPSLTRIRPRLTALAGLGLVTVMVLAAGFHATHGEASKIGFNFVLGGLAGFVAWGRGRRLPIFSHAPRG